MAIQRCEKCQADDRQHKYQDEKYGKYNRVVCPCKAGMKVRCTICSHEQDKK